jgi:predicted DNA-binding protein with PD1-like motif
LSRGTFGWSNAGSSEPGQRRIELREGAEIVSLMGNIYTDDKGQSVVHAHGAVALSDGTVKGGHWWEEHVSIVAVVFVIEEEGAPPAPK